MSTATYPEPTLPRHFRRLFTIAAVVAVALSGLVAVLVERGPGPPSVWAEGSTAAVDAEFDRLRQLAEHGRTRAAGSSSELALTAETDRLRQLAESWQTRHGGDAVAGSAADRAELARMLMLAEALGSES